MLRFKLRETMLSPFPCPEDMDPTLHRLLIRRGIDSAQAARRFLEPDAEQLSDPFLLNDMAASVDSIRSALERAEPICVYGDYDVDGVSASAILADHLRSMGGQVEVYIPSRHREGYGLNEAAVRQIGERTKLLITVDCGVTNLDEVALARSLGMDVIVTDHHRPGDKLPDCPTVDPLLNGYPFPYLCGAGVAFRLVEALSGRAAALEYVDIAALATVADVVSLTGENRVIVRLGLERMNTHPRPAFRALVEVAGLRGRALNTGNIAFQFAPRLNAGGRMGSAMRSHELLLMRTIEEAMPVAEELERENQQRREEEKRILDEAEAMIAEYPFPERRSLVLKGESWNPGIIGLAAGRLAEKYYYPTILLSASDGVLTGSCRSIPGVDIHAALTAVKHHFVRYGGHRQAAGLTMDAGEYEGFCRDIEAWLSANVPADAWIPEKEYDLDVSFDHLTESFVQSLRAIEPTGYGNPAPVFRAQPHVESERAIGANGAHLSLMLSNCGAQRRGVFFGAGHLHGALGDAIDMLYTPKINVFNGRTSVETELKALSDGGAAEAFRTKMSNEAVLQHDFLTDILYNGTIDFYYPDAPEISIEALREQLAANVQGTLIVAADLGQALALVEALGDVPLDTAAGAAHLDARCYNTLWAYPVGRPAGRWRSVVSAGLPAHGALYANAAIHAPSPLWQQAPELDELRQIFMAARPLMRGVERWYTLEQLLALLKRDTGFDTVKCLMGLFILNEAELIAFDPRRACGVQQGAPVLQPGSKKKGDPTDTKLYRGLMALKG